MPFEQIALADLSVNRSNDRHGELENETAAIAELFRLRDGHMRALAGDIAAERGIYDPPLIGPDGDRYVVFDGNRRITCLKLIHTPSRAPTRELQIFFQSIQDRWAGDLPNSIVCQVEEDRDRIDAILFRRHTGSQGGVGQSDWDDRAKHNFIERTGRGGRVDVAVEVENLLRDDHCLPTQNLPRSTLNRLLSSEVNRRRVGVSVVGNRFRLTHDRARVVAALARVADDLSSREVVLGDLWDNEGKRAYLNRLEAAGVLPQEADAIPDVVQPARRAAPARGRPQARRQATTFIPNDAVEVAWTGEQARARAIWDELRALSLAEYPNAVSALTRILLELSVESYLRRQDLYRDNDALADHVRRAADHLNQREVIDQQYRDEVNRLRRDDELISIRSMQRFVHSETFAPSPRELEIYWTRLGRFISACLSH